MHMIIRIMIITIMATSTMTMSITTMITAISWQMRSSGRLL